MAAGFNPADIPLGYRFMPTDLELVRGYLSKKIKNEKLPISDIYEVHLYQYNPETLAENYPKLGENEWYFFTPREKKYKNGNRPNRAAGSGYWKATGADKTIFAEDKTTIVGYKKALVFHEGKSPNGKKTNWIMHEFTINEPRSSKRSANDMRLDDWVLCRFYKKATRVGEPNQQEPATLASVNQNNPSESTEVNLAQTSSIQGNIEAANNEYLEQISNILDNIEIDNNNNINNNFNFNPIVTYDNNATANNVYPGLHNDQTFFEDVDCLSKHFADFPNDTPNFENALPQNVPEASSPLKNPGFDWGPNPFTELLNVPESSFLDLEGWGIQQQEDFQVQESSWGLQNFPNLSQTGPSDDNKKGGVVIKKTPDDS